MYVRKEADRRRVSQQKSGRVTESSSSFKNLRPALSLTAVLLVRTGTSRSTAVTSDVVRRPTCSVLLSLVGAAVTIS
jgi:hypothetical protein